MTNIPMYLMDYKMQKNIYYCDCPEIPTGFVVQFCIFSTWGDRYYCGLDGLELYDCLGNKIYLDDSRTTRKFLNTNNFKYIHLQTSVRILKV